MPLHWGIVSTGKNSHDFVRAVQTLPHEDHIIASVASLNHEDSVTFSESHKIPTAYEGYLKLAKDSEVDVVYVGNLIVDHYATCKMLLEHKKHVLCEKPLTMCSSETRDLIATAEEKGLFLMEAFWSRCSPVYYELERRLMAGKIGTVEHITADYGVLVEENETGEGAVMNFGVNALQLCQFVHRYEKPVQIEAAGNFNAYGNDDCTGIVLIYPEGKTCAISSSMRVNLSNTARLYGSTGIMEIPEFWGPSEIKTPTESYCCPLPESPAIFNNARNVGLAYAAEEARRRILDGVSESPRLTHKESLELAEAVDAVRQKMGIMVYQRDTENFFEVCT